MTGFHAVHGGYASCITVSTHWPTDLVAGDTNAWYSPNITTNAARVQNNYICSGPHTIALNCGTLGGAVNSDMATFSNNYCDGVGLGFNSDTFGVKHLTIANNTFTNCYQGVNFGGPNIGCGDYTWWTDITISANKFAFLGQPQVTNYYTFDLRRNELCAPTQPPGVYCWTVNGNASLHQPVWHDCFAVRLAGGTGNITISGNQCTTVDSSLWQGPPGLPQQYYVVQSLADTWVNPNFTQPDCSRDNASTTPSGNTASSCAYCYSPNAYPNTADTPNQSQAVPNGLLVPSQSLGGGPQTGSSGFYGLKFTVGASAIGVTQLGRWGCPGNSGTHTLMLTDQYGNELIDPQTQIKAEVIVTMSGSGQYVYGPLTPHFTLSANTTYALLSYENGSGDSWYNYDATSLTPACVAGSAVAVSAPQRPPYTLTPIGSGNQSYGPVNLIFQE